VNKPAPHPEQVFKRYFPLEVVDYCLDLWKKYAFKFIVSKKRNSKLGDYRHHRILNTHIISVNSDLNKFSFMITYLHEVAHLTTQLKFKDSVSPHGKEWKNEFKILMMPMLEKRFLPSDVQHALVAYMNNPGASSCSDQNLLKTLHRYDKNFDASVTYLEEVSLGTDFDFNGRIFRKEAVRRTKALCLELKSQRRYLISLVAKVSLV